jgi:hypothetical protein
MQSYNSRFKDKIEEVKKTKSNPQPNNTNVVSEQQYLDRVKIFIIGNTKRG